MTDQITTILAQFFTNSAVLGALVGGGVTATVSLIAYFWRLHTTAVVNKTTIQEHMKTSEERDKHLETKIDNVGNRVSRVNGKMDKVADKMDALVEAHHQTHEILVTHIAHEEAQEKVIENLSEKIKASGRR